jgi:hypothetical protein
MHRENHQNLKVNKSLTRAILVGIPWWKKTKKLVPNLMSKAVIPQDHSRGDTVLHRGYPVG